MKYSTSFFIIILIIFLESCSSKKEDVSLIKEVDQQAELVATYAEAMENLEKNDTFFAANKFLEAELLFPQSEWAPKSALMAAYSFYLQDFYSKSIFHLERFLSTYPKDKRISYAYYLLAMCYFENIEDEKRDLLPLIKSKDLFEFIIKEYPKTDFAIDAKFKIDYINDIMASKEIYIGRHYIKKEKWIAAINRFKTVIENYETTIYVEEAIHRIVEIYYRIGLINESTKYAKLLGYNYGSSEWYEKSYAIFNKDYGKIDKDEDIKKPKKGIIKTFKKLFE
jgi:outer membrane protein assembly factor BamD